MKTYNKATSYLRGHLIIFKNNEWLYEDTMTPTVNNERICGYCGAANDENGHDGCLGTLLGVMNACCGHGNQEQAYIQFNNKHCIHGTEALKIIERLKK